MSKICTLDTTEIDNILNNLDEDSRKKAMFNSLVKGGQELIKETQSELLRVLPNANKEMVDGVRLKKDKKYNEVITHIMGDYRLKWFEMGTDSRYLKSPLPNSKKENLPYRGKIEPKYFFQKARESSNMINVMVEKLIEELNKLMK